MSWKDTIGSIVDWSLGYNIAEYRIKAPPPMDVVGPVLSRADSLPILPPLLAHLDDARMRCHEQEESLGVHGVHQVVHEELYRFKILMLARQRGTTFKERLWRALLSILQMERLVKTLEAVRYMQHRAFVAKCFHELLRPQETATTDSFRIKARADMGCEGVDELETSVESTLTQALIWMLVATIPSWKVRGLFKHEDAAGFDVETHRTMEIMSCGIRRISASGGAEWCVVHPSRVSADAHLEHLSREDALLLDVGRAGPNKAQCALEAVVFDNYRALLSGLVGELAAQMQTALNVQRILIGAVIGLAVVLARRLSSS
uniref:Uncharacterized protein n=1 Tax=Noctiluca scintillans TaxID=2966 RepID=A0A7S1EV36_NOCSC|mmetsp:Transcript_11361/g.31723  ORF Transcript_11361/g.31723 Transcript_11361/m.31723 type:complete len:318 (+) Transcript_11361:52-1005(+)